MAMPPVIHQSKSKAAVAILRTVGWVCQLRVYPFVLDCPELANDVMLALMKLPKSKSAVAACGPACRGLRCRSGPSESNDSQIQQLRPNIFGLGRTTWAPPTVVNWGDCTVSSQLIHRPHCVFLASLPLVIASPTDIGDHDDDNDESLLHTKSDAKFADRHYQ